ncbi:MAG TPA: hypothetical protein VHM70_26615 [Polyangiaceae bacterium]|nr:hypothetical protein [Polyangiaceae bacterium]
MSAFAAVCCLGCGPGINVDRPDDQGQVSVPDTAHSEPAKSATAKPAQPESDAGEAIATRTTSSLPTPLGPSAPGSTAEEQPTDPEPSAAGGSAGLGSGGTGGDESAQPSSVPVPAPDTELLPPPNSLSPTMTTRPAMTTPVGAIPAGCAEPTTVDQRNCSIAPGADRDYLYVYLDEDLQYSVDQVVASPSHLTDATAWCSVGYVLTSGKAIEISINWDNAPADASGMLFVMIARMDNGCPIIEVPIQLRGAATGNTCEVSKPLSGAAN